MKMFKMKTIVLNILIILSINPYLIHSSREKLIDDNINGLIASFGDFDSDKFTDVFIITENGKSLELLKGFPTEPVLRKWSSIKCTFRTEDIIVGVIASDFTGNATMDVLVVTNPSSKIKDSFNIWLFKGNLYSLDCNNNSKPLVTSVKSHPLVLDFNGDMISDFIVETDDCRKQLWTKFSGPLQPSCPPELQSKKTNQTMRFPNSNAFINLDPFNCTETLTPDIFISGEDYLEYWKNNQGFNDFAMILHPYPDKDLYPHLGQSAFVDINIDGQIEHILPVCMSDRKTCRVLAYDSSAKKEWTVISDLSFGNESSLYFSEIETFGQILPITLRHGDTDGDGYTDLITVMKDNENNFKAVILKNIKSNNTFGRQFVIDWTSDKHLTPGRDVEIVAFIDLFEDGKLDILMTTKDKTTGTYWVEVVLNTQMVAACFLKVLVTSGLCYEASCPRGNIPYGTNQFGPYVCYQLQDLDGNWQTACAGQLSQSAHLALQMPYSVFGLGETPNFVENVFASIPSGKMPSRHSKWTQIVPDAQVVLIPFPPNDTRNWISKLFYTPSNIVFSTLITLASICCILVLIIGILHRKELLEDLAEHEEYKRHWPESR